MLFMLLSFAVGLIIVLISALIIYSRWHYGILESMGLPVIKPYFICGSDPWGYKKISQHDDLERYHKYGPVFGTYEGRTPRVYVADPEMIRLILVKDFDYFYDRTALNFGNGMADQMLDFLPVGKWKVVRSQLTPMFTSGRIKNMGNIVKDLADDYVCDISEKMDSEKVDRIKFNPREFMVPFILDTTAKTFLGIVLPDRKDPKNYLVELLQIIMFEDFEPNFMITLMECFPFIQNYLPGLQMKGLDRFVSTLNNIISARRKSEVKENDFIQIIIDMLDKVDTAEYKKLNITKDTIFAQALEFFVAGYDSVGNTMSMLVYYLASNPEIQDIVANELEKLTENSESKILDHNALEEAHYLTACITETVRLCPPFTRSERLCCKDWKYKGMTIKKGVSVYINSWAANRNPEPFPEPEKFDPTRFMPENKKKIHPYAMTSFGFGPRGCIGQRFAYEMLSLLAARMITEFRFVAREDESEPKLIPGWGVMSRYYPFSVDLVKRK